MDNCHKQAPTQVLIGPAGLHANPMYLLFGLLVYKRVEHRWLNAQTREPASIPSELLQCGTRKTGGCVASSRYGPATEVPTHAHGL